MTEEPFDALDAGVLGIIALYEAIAAEPVPERLLAVLDDPDSHVPSTAGPGGLPDAATASS